MESIQTIFSNVIKENRDNQNFAKILGDTCFELSRKKIQRLKSDQKIQDRVAELFEQYCKTLENEGVLNSYNTSIVIESLLKAANQDREEFLYKTLYEIEQLKKSAQNQQKEIKDSITNTYKILEKHINSLPDDLKRVSLVALNDTKLNALEMLGILRETTEEALLATLEKRSDIEDTTSQITKNLTFQAIKNGEFTKRRFLNTTKTIMEVALELANENLAYSKELINGAVSGTKDGILKALEKFKNDIKYAPKDDDLFGQDFDTIKKELAKIEDEYIEMLKDLSNKYDGEIKKILDEKIEKYDNSVEKIKRATLEAKEAISQRLEEFKSDVSLEEIREKAGERFENLKKDVNELSKKANITLENIKQNKTAKRATDEAKKLGLRAWEVAKNMLENRGNKN